MSTQRLTRFIWHLSADNRRRQRRMDSSITCKYVHNRMCQVLLGLRKAFFKDYVCHVWPVSKQNQNEHDNSSNESSLLLQLLNGGWFRRAAVAQGRKSNAGAASCRKMEKCLCVIISSACVSTFVNQQRWDVRCCVCDSFQAPAEVQKPESLSFSENSFNWGVAVCARGKAKKQREYNHHGNCPLRTKGELGRGGQENRHKRRSQPHWSNFCYSPCLLKRCFTKNM